MTQTENVITHGCPPYRVAVIHGGPGAPGSAAEPAAMLGLHFGTLEPRQSADSLDGQTQELARQLEQYAQLPVCLIGHSWGAMLGLIFAAKYPAMVSKLILVASGVYTEESAEDLKNIRMNRLDEPDRTEAEELFRKLSDLSHPAPDNWLERLDQLMKKTENWDALPENAEKTKDSIPVFQHKVHSKVWNQAKLLRKSGGFIELASKIKCPVVAIHGDFDPHPADGVKNPLAGVLPDFRFILLEKCGHQPWREKYAQDRFLEILLKEVGASNG